MTSTSGTSARSVHISREEAAAWRAAGAAALIASVDADYSTYRSLIEEKLVAVTEAFWKADTLASAIPVAARNGDWVSFERWIAAYEALPKALRRDHPACAILNLQGLRALDSQRPDEAERIMKLVLEMAPALQFLSNDDVSCLAERLRAEGRATTLCDAFDALREQNDWRTIEE